MYRMLSLWPPMCVLYNLRVVTAHLLVTTTVGKCLHNRRNGKRNERSDTESGSI